MDYILLPCIYKQFFGISCPMCGFQRGMICLMQGNIIGSIEMFPPLLFLLFTIIVSAISYLRKKTLNLRLVKILWIITAVLLIANAFYQNLKG